tara:strand:+ start:259 stop:1767 length:1509 start_codon:yes stop_codon:yes gene_type:complete
MSELVIGIDLGTTYSGAAYIDESGFPCMIPNKRGKNITPSVVSIVNSKSQVGEAAKNVLISNPDNTIDEVKRYIGSDKTYSIDGENHTPTSISALILADIKSYVESHCKKEVSSAVISVPANFGDAQRKETMRAAEMAGLNVEFIINEPTAAALAYAKFSNQKTSGVYAIYDLGGGTFDCTIAYIDGDNVDIKTSQGVTTLGGKDFDEELLKIVQKKYKKIAKKELPITKYNMNIAEKDKVELSFQDEIMIFIDDVTIEVKRSEFELSIKNLVQQTMMAFEAALTSKDYSFDDLEDVILAGGSTRIPYVQERLEKLTGIKPEIHENPDETIALGAALYSAKKHSSSLNPNQRAAVAGLDIEEVANMNYGTFAVDETLGTYGKLNSIIIEKDTKIPCSQTRTYYTLSDNQEAIACEVTECSEHETSPEFVFVQWEGTLDLPHGRPAGQAIEVTYSYNANQSMECEFHDLSSGRKLSQTIEMAAARKEGKGSDEVDDISKFRVD